MYFISKALLSAPEIPRPNHENSGTWITMQKYNYVVEELKIHCYNSSWVSPFEL